MIPPTLIPRVGVPPPCRYGRVILAGCAMLDKLNKLVAVAEAMAAQRNEMCVGVDGIEVQVDGHGGIVRLGMMREYAVYHPDENQYMPEYGMDYDSYYFTWVDDTWVRNVSEYLEAPSPVYVQEEDWDELPF